MSRRSGGVAWQVLGRVGSGLLSVWGAVTIVFLLTRLTGDPTHTLAPPTATPAQIRLIGHQLGLDQPLPVQYVQFLGRAVTGNFGQSYYWNTAVTGLLLQHVLPTVALAFLAVLMAVGIGIPLGLISAFRGGTVLDGALSAMGGLVQAIPAFWLGPLVILLFAVMLRLLPPTGLQDWQSFVLPVVTLGAFQTAFLFRITRAAALEAVSQDYVRLARAKGARTLRVALGHVLPEISLPILTVVGLGLANLLGGSVVVETIFGWPGIGNLLIQASSERDFPVIEGVAVLFAVGYVLINTVVDVLYTVIDPRARQVEAI